MPRFFTRLELAKLAEDLETDGERSNGEFTADIYEARGFTVRRRPETPTGRAWAYLESSRWIAMQTYASSVDAALTLLTDTDRLHLYYMPDVPRLRWVADVGAGYQAIAFDPARAICAVYIRRMAARTAP